MLEMGIDPQDKINVYEFIPRMNKNKNESSQI